MNTVTRSHVPILKSEVNFTSAPASVVQRVQNEILISIHTSPNTILLTGRPGKGTSTLLRTIGNKIAANDRLIILSGSDLLRSELPAKDTQSENSARNTVQENDFSTIKDFIHESAKLDDVLTVIIDAVDCLPNEVLKEIFSLNKQLESDTDGINLILGGTPKLKKHLDSIDGLSLNNLVHYSLDEVNEKDIRLFSAKKDYRIKPTKGELQFDRDSLKSLAEYTTGDIQLLDVLLEWCSALSNKKKSNIVSNEIVSKAISFAKQSAKDSGAFIADAYPTQKEINRLAAEKNFGKKQIKKSAFVQAEHIQTEPIKDKEYSSADIPKITATPSKPSEIPLDEIAELEKEVMPTQWVPTEKHSIANKKAPFLFRAIAPLLVVGLIVVIILQLQPSSIDHDDVMTSNQVEPFNNGADTQIISEETTPIEVDDSGDLLAEQKTSPEVDKIDVASNKEVKIVTATNNLDENVTASIEDEIRNKPESTKQPTNIEPNDSAKIDQVAKADIEQDLPANIGPIAQTNIEPNDSAKIDQVAKADIEQDDSANIEPTAQTNIESNIPTNIEQTAQADIEPITTASIEPKAPENIQQITQTNIEPNAAENKNQSAQTNIESITSNQDAEIIKLLGTASQQFVAKNLTTPPGGNAVETYQAILAMRPNHVAAKQGIQNIHDRYVNWASYYMKNNNQERSIYFFGKALEVDPDDIVSKQMISNLSTKVTLSTDQAEINTNSNSIVVEENNTNLLVGELLIKAKQQLQDKNLTSPPNNNAFETYKQVLKTEPDNAAALQGLSIIKKSYISWAEQDLKHNNPHRAAMFYKKALAVDPADSQVAQKLEAITSQNR